MSVMNLFNHRAVKLALVASALVALSACAAQGGYNTRSSSYYGQQQYGTDWTCIGGTVAGGVVGAVVGNQFGGGTGRTVLTGVGAAGGALAGHELAC